MITDIPKITEEVVLGIPVYNAYEYLVGCLDSLDQNYPQQLLILVDDQSSDSKIKQHFQAYAESRTRKTVCVYREKRGWFTRAANTCLRTAWDMGCEWLLLLNSDVVVDRGALEEMLTCWQLAEQEGHQVGLVGSHGPQPVTHKRWEVAREPGYVTMHAVLLNKNILEQNGIPGFPQADHQVKGFHASGLVHINSDRALSYWLNRKGLAPVVSYWSGIGHHGGRSWNYDLGAALGQNPAQLGD